MAAESALRRAATLIPVRDTPGGIEVLLLQRTKEAIFLAGAHVFPGGAIDDADQQASCACAPVDGAQLDRRLGVSDDALLYWIAAIRECFEEAGLLFACNADGAYPDDDALARLQPQRTRMHHGDYRLVELCDELQLRLPVERLAYFGHWITPPGAPRRYDTRFFIAVAPLGQTPCHDGNEIISHCWIRPQDAIARFEQGEMQLAFSTRTTLEAIAVFADSAALLSHAHQQTDVPCHMPRRARRGDKFQVLIRDHPAYDEVCKLDPAGKGRARCEIVHGEAVRLSPRVVRVTANNGGMMTGPGTNSYLIGDPGGDMLLIDPGPADPAHIRALLHACGGRLRWILATHTHHDHTPGAGALKAATGAQLLGRPAPTGSTQDLSFVPDRLLHHGERLVLGDVTLRVLHTPGHASNHLCYLLEEEGLLFSGDHIMQGSTVVISPPDGDMRAYLNSLRALLAEPVDCIAPAHGFLIGSPKQAITGLIRHRLAREQKILDALRQGEFTAAELLPQLYQKLPRALHGPAQRTILAHLVKLADEGAVIKRGERWRYQTSLRHNALLTGEML